MFGGDDSSSSAVLAKKTGNREWDDGSLAGGAWHIGASEGSREAVQQKKRMAQLAYQEALDADRATSLAKKAEKENDHRLQAASFNAGGNNLSSVSQIGAGSPAPMADLRATIKQQLALNKLDVISMIAQDSDPSNSPRARVAAQLDGDSAPEFCIGQSEAEVRRRKAMQKAAYLQQLDADTGKGSGSGSTSARGRGWDHEVASGVTGLQIGLGKPSMDMSPSMKNLHVDSKLAKQAEYRRALADQMAAGAALKAKAKADSQVDVTEPLPYMRY